MCPCKEPSHHLHLWYKVTQILTYSHFFATYLMSKEKVLEPEIYFSLMNPFMFSSIYQIFLKSQLFLNLYTCTTSLLGCFFFLYFYDWFVFLVITSIFSSLGLLFIDKTYKTSSSLLWMWMSLFFLHFFLYPLISTFILSFVSRFPLSAKTDFRNNKTKRTSHLISQVTRHDTLS